MAIHRSVFLFLVGLFIAGLLGCGNSDAPVTPELAVLVGAESTELPPTSTPKPAATGDAPATQEQDAVDIMWQMIGRYGAANEGAVIAAGRTFEPGLVLEIARALERINGESLGGDYVLTGPWFSWMSRQDPPQVMLAGFDEWKGELLATIDPSFKDFIYEDVPTRIPIWTVAWGGVVRDGIPPLEFPDTVPGNEVDFLNFDEPVFGVTINGESRAYPHRIMGWHELANDRLGGELITFVF